MKKERRHLMFTLVSVAAVVSACSMRNEADEARLMELEKRIEKLEWQVEDLGDRIDALREQLIMVQTAPTPTPSPTWKYKKLSARCEEEEEGRYMLTPEEAAEVKKNIGGFAADARILPNVQDDEIKGFKLYGIRSDSFVGSCGITNGDVIFEINGLALNSPDQALTAFEKVKKEGEAHLKILRKEQIIEMVISVSEEKPKK